MNPHKLVRKKRLRRHRRVRKKVFGTPERPRLSVFKSLRHIHAQIIDDLNGTTLCGASSLSPALRERVSYGGNIPAAREVGKYLASLAKEKGITEVVFDRGGYRYHGRVKALADGAREEGLQF